MDKTTLIKLKIGDSERQQRKSYRGKEMWYEGERELKYTFGSRSQQNRKTTFLTM
jgi:hypothetical protein